MKKHIFVLIIIAALTIGYASVSTILNLNGNINIGLNTEDLEVYFSKALINGKLKNSIIKEDVKIEKTFTINENITSILVDYDVTNGSMQYDMAIDVECITDNESIDLINLFNSKEILKSTETRSGNVEIIPTINTPAYDITLTCTLTSSLIPRESISDGTPNSKISPTINLYNMTKLKNKGDDTLLNFNYSAEDEDTGVYSIKGENDTDVYFYRGNITDNNIIFANTCWKIVRTTETQGTKIIYNGIPTNGTCDNTGDNSQIGTSKWHVKANDNAYVGYMYGEPGSNNYEKTHTNKNPSTIKTYIDEWYKNNIKDTEYESLLEDTVWCNDRSMVTGDDNNTLNSSSDISYGILGYEKNKTGYGVLARASSYTKEVTPSLICPQENDKFTVNASNGNGMLDYPIGLMTMDEYALAGYTSGTGSDGSEKSSRFVPKTNYLYTTKWVWSFSPVYMGNSIATVGGISTSLLNGFVFTAYGVRPSISLKSDTEIIDGDGTVNNPYIIE